MKKPSEIDLEELVRAVYFYFYEAQIDGHTDWMDIHHAHICEELGIPFRQEWEGDWAAERESFNELYWINEDEFDMTEPIVMSAQIPVFP